MDIIPDVKNRLGKASKELGELVAQIVAAKAVSVYLCRRMRNMLMCMRPRMCLLK